MRKKINISFMLVLLAMLAFNACEQFVWDPPKWDPDDNSNPERPRPIVYDDHVAPLFEEYNCTGCHQGSIPPDLSPANSYSALTGGSYLNADDAEDSEVAIRVADPEHGGTWSTVDYFTLLDWIYFVTN